MNSHSIEIFSAPASGSSFLFDLCCELLDNMEIKEINHSVPSGDSSALILFRHPYNSILSLLKNQGLEVNNENLDTCCQDFFARGGQNIMDNKEALMTNMNVYFFTFEEIYFETDKTIQRIQNITDVSVPATRIQSVKANSLKYTSKRVNESIDYNYLMTQEHISHLQKNVLLNDYLHLYEQISSIQECKIVDCLQVGKMDYYLGKYPVPNYFGIGNIIQGLLTLIKLQQRFSFSLVINSVLHPIHPFISNLSVSMEDKVSLKKQIIPFITELTPLVEYILNSSLNNGVILLGTNSSFDETMQTQTEIDVHCLKKSEKRLFQKLFKPSTYMKTILADINYDNFNIIHFRMFDKYSILKQVISPKILYMLTVLFTKYYEKQDILICNNQQLKTHLIKHTPCRTFNSKIVHLGFAHEQESILSTLSEFFIVQRAKKIKTFSQYDNISGFVCWTSMLNNIPLLNLKLDSLFNKQLDSKESNTVDPVLSYSQFKALHNGNEQIENEEKVEEEQEKEKLNIVTFEPFRQEHKEFTMNYSGHSKNTNALDLFQEEYVEQERDGLLVINKGRVRSKSIDIPVDNIFSEKTAEGNVVLSTSQRNSTALDLGSSVEMSEKKVEGDVVLSTSQRNSIALDLGSSVEMSEKKVEGDVVLRSAQKQDTKPLFEITHENTQEYGTTRNEDILLKGKRANSSLEIQYEVVDGVDVHPTIESSDLAFASSHVKKHPLVLIDNYDVYEVNKEKIVSESVILEKGVNKKYKPFDYLEESRTTTNMPEDINKPLFIDYGRGKSSVLDFSVSNSQPELPKTVIDDSILQNYSVNPTKNIVFEDDNHYDIIQDAPLNTIIMGNEKHYDTQLLDLKELETDIVYSDPVRVNQSFVHKYIPKNNFLKLNKINRTIQKPVQDIARENINILLKPKKPVEKYVNPEERERLEKRRIRIAKKKRRIALQKKREEEERRKNNHNKIHRKRMKELTKLIPV